MKLTFIAIILFSTTSVSFGQWSNTSNNQTQGAVKLKDYLLFDADGDFTGGNYFTIQDHSTANYLRFGYGFNNHLILSATGNLGIGTTTPTHKLDVNTGSGYFKTYKYGAEYTVNTTGGWARSFRLRNENNNATVAYGAYSGRAYISTGFNPTADPTGYQNQKLTILSNGNVGIGTTNPDMKLSVLSSDKFVTRFGYTGTDAIAGVRTGRASSYADLVNLGSGFGIGVGTSGGNLPLNSQSTSHVDLYIDKIYGNVGIGTTTPDQKLTVNGSVNVGGSGNGTLWVRHLNGKMANGFGNDNLYLNYNTGKSVLMGFGGKDSNLLVSGKIGIGTTSLDQGILRVNGAVQIGEVGGAYKDLILEDGTLLTGYNGTFEIHPRTVPGSGTAKHATYFKTPYSGNLLGKTRHDVLIDGFVGIGTITPDEALTVRGRIHTSEVRVDLEDEVAPDYVFEPEYNLMPLADIKAYIQIEKHLPEVPSGADMEADGINLKEMNLLLLKKVEELTLHLIAQDESIRSLQSENKAQSIKLIELEKRN